MSAALPGRPRLAEHALARRHLVDGAEVVVVHDARSGDVTRLAPGLWEVLEACDGTRAIDGVARSAAGAGWQEGELRAALAELHRRGLLADGIAPPPAPEAAPADRPLDVLPDFQLACDESGVCCGMYGSVLFTPAEADRARTLQPAVLAERAPRQPRQPPGERGRPDRAFMPAAGVDRGALAVAFTDGCCPYLAGDGRCSLHVAGGERGKPRSCLDYPATLVDDGEAVRVSVAVECPCVLASAVLWPPLQHAARRAPAQALLPSTARVLADLGPGARTSAVPERVVISAEGGGQSRHRAAFVAWSRAAASAEFPRDAVAGFWSLAEAVAAAGLDERAARRALRTAARPSAEELGPWMEALERRAEARLAVAASFRSERDRVRAGIGWVAEAARALRAPGALEEALRAGDRREGQAPGAFPVNPEAEAFYARATLHGHHLALDGAPLATALRDRAARLLVSRALGAVLARSAPQDPALDYPITLVEVLMRAHGLRAYAAAADRQAGAEGAGAPPGSPGAQGSRGFQKT